MKDIVLVTGSTAIDQTGLYQGSFEEYQSRYTINAFNASFQLSSMKTSFGGCAPNIAYGLHQLGISAIPLSSAGRNFRDRYLAHLNDIGINTDFITIDDDVENCASCLMINDLHGNQLIGFYPGPSNPKRYLPSELPVIDQVALAILGPEEPQLTLRQGRDLAALNVPLLVDPGQVTTAFNRQEIRELLTIADYLVVNDYEYSVLKANGDLTDEQILAMVPEVVVTHGDKGVDIFHQDISHHVDAVPDVDIVEVTGCGDAFRAGYAYGILKGLLLKERAQMGCIMAMTNLGAPETQGYQISVEELLALQERFYG